MDIAEVSRAELLDQIEEDRFGVAVHGVIEGLTGESLMPTRLLSQTCKIASVTSRAKRARFSIDWP